MNEKLFCLFRFMPSVKQKELENGQFWSRSLSRDHTKRDQYHDTNTIPIPSLFVYYLINNYFLCFCTCVHLFYFPVMTHVMTSPVEDR